MDLLQRLLLATIFFSCVKSQDLIAYTPEIVQNDVPGKITASTFALKQPVCVFENYKTTCNNCNVWVAVAIPQGATESINITGVSYQKFPSNSLAYLTLSTPLSYIGCSDVEANTVRAFRIGADTTCQNNPTANQCNGPLPSSARVYSARYFLYNNLTQIASTLWSAPITLKTALPWESIDTWPGQRTGGMVVVTSILIVLLAILLVLMIAMLVYSCIPLFRKGENYAVPPTPKGSFRITRYNTHNMSETNGHGTRQNQQPAKP